MKKTVLLFVLAISLALPGVCFAVYPLDTVSVPEPATGLLLLLGGAGVAAVRMFRARRP
jgi:hypothetical protein